MREAITNKRKGRERNVHLSRIERDIFGACMRAYRGGESSTRLEDEVGKLACESCMKWRCVCVEVDF